MSALINIPEKESTALVSAIVWLLENHAVPKAKALNQDFVADKLVKIVSSLYDLFRSYSKLYTPENENSIEASEILSFYRLKDDCRSVIGANMAAIEKQMADDLMKQG